ncbi:MAG TPA: hypothetical protein VMC08_01315 [Bacteroidales bacterium]|nr:hypothetical protein [Bacteroidales bacterium]
MKKLTICTGIMLAILFMFAVACKKTDPTPTDPPITNENHNPAKPKVIYPMDEAEVSGNQVILSWSSTDPDGDLMTHDVYLGTLGYLTHRVAFRISDQSVTVGDLQKGTMYHWKVVSYDVHGAFTESDVWSFTVK